MLQHQYVTEQAPLQSCASSYPDVEFMLAQLDEFGQIGFYMRRRQCRQRKRATEAMYGGGNGVRATPKPEANGPSKYIWARRAFKGKRRQQRQLGKQGCVWGGPIAMWGHSYGVFSVRRNLTTSLGVGLRVCLIKEERAVLQDWCC